MLSNFLNSIKKLRTHKTPTVEFPKELMMTLSFIESGCLATSLNNMTVFVFKGSHSEIESINKTSQIFFGLECIKRPEFPSVRINFDLRGKSNKPYLFDYFFNIESNEDMKLLGNIREQDYLDVLFFDSRIVYSKRIEMTKKDKEKIKEVLDQARA